MGFSFAEMKYMDPKQVKEESVNLGLQSPRSIDHDMEQQMAAGD